MTNSSIMNDRSNASTPGKQEPESTGHCYDGIEEYDNPLPGWWKWLFIGSIAICPPYWAYYHLGTEGRSPIANYEVALAANARLQFAEIGELEGDRVTIVKYMNEKSWLSFGKSIYQTNCISCHKADGSGLVGPNLADDHYKNVKNIEDLYTVIANGAGGGAMPAWKTRLSKNEVVLAAAYAASLRGAPVPETAKPPEGSLIQPWPTLDEVVVAKEADGDTVSE
jgi:cytochrome c oxidase cbb3-type subunit 3